MGQSDIHTGMYELAHTSHHHKNRFKLNVKTKTIKFIEENFCDLELGKTSSDITLKAQSIKENIDKLGLIKM